MSSGPHRFRLPEIRRLVRGFGESTGLSPQQVTLEASPDGTMRVTAKSYHDASASETDSPSDWSTLIDRATP
jgi:hypothetical protein